MNDIRRRQLVLLNADLSLRIVLADSTPATGRGYSSVAAGLVPFHGDSTLFIDPASLSITVLDDHGEAARIMAIPRPSDASFMVGGPFGTPGLDDNGRLIYRAAARSPRPPTELPLPGVWFDSPTSPDTAPVVRVDLSSRATDTIAWVRIPVTRLRTRTDDNGDVQMVTVIDPLPIVDDWAILKDGRVAIVRGGDYHLDILDATGHTSKTSRIPFGWQRLDDDEKRRVLDSTRTAAAAAIAAMQEPARPSETGAATARPPANAAAAAGTGGFVGSDDPTSRGTAGRPRVRASVDVVAPQQLPDYRPPIRQGASRVDPRGLLWVKTTLVTDAGCAVYDIIDENGVLVDRLHLPFGRVLVGFSGEHAVLAVLDESGARLELARIR